MRKFVVAVGLLGLFALPLLAQDAPKAEVFGGYQYTRINPGGENFNGWNAALTWNATQTLGLTADFSGAYKSIAGISLKQHTFLFGPTLAARSSETFTPFVRALFGGAHFSAAGFSDTAFAMALGGGVDVKVLDNIAIRAIQADYLMTRFGSNTQNNVRISAGVVFRF